MGIIFFVLEMFARMFSYYCYVLLLLFGVVCYGFFCVCECVWEYWDGD